MNIRLSLLTKSQKLLHPLLKLRTLHTAGSIKCAWMRSLYQMLFWKSRLWNSEMDVQRRWLCALVPPCSDVQHYVDIGFLQWLLPFIAQYQWQFAFIEVTWQQASKHINKSIICATVAMYRSQFIAVSGVKGSGREVKKFVIQTLWFVALFQLVKGDFPQEKLS